MHTEMVSYSPGDEVIVSYDLVSDMSAPIVEGMTRIQIFYIDSDGGEQLFDEFIDMSDISMQKGDRIEREFFWNVPEGAPSGEYTIKAYLISGDMFNLLGLSFLAYGPPGVPGEMTTFDVINNGRESFVLIDRDETYLNGEKYVFGDYSPAIAGGSDVEIKTKVTNTGTDKRVDVTCEIYAWDDVKGAPMNGYYEKKTITLREGAQDVSFEFPALDTGAYEIRITAAAPNQKSIVKMRTSVGGAKGRFIFAGLKSFPLVSGEQNAVFFCMSNSADYITYFDAKGTVEIADDSGKVIYEDSWGPTEIIPSPMGMISEFVANTDSSYLTLTVRMNDEDGKLMDESRVVYDISKFTNIDARLKVSTDKNEYAFGDELKYTIRYANGDEAELRGEIITYILDPDNVPIYVKEGERIDGELTDSITLKGKEGTYKIIAKEITHDISSETGFALGAKTETNDMQTTDISDDVSDSKNTAAYFILIAAVLIVGALAYIYNKKGRR